MISLTFKSTLRRLVTTHRSRGYSLTISHEVQQAIAAGKPVVALESTIISHGMPYPRNLEVARMVENVVRQNGAVPATIAIIKGTLKVGLDEPDLMELSQPSSSHPVYKASTRDLAFMSVSKRTAGTTVAGTMVLAEKAGDNNNKTFSFFPFVCTNFISCSFSTCAYF